MEKHKKNVSFEFSAGGIVIDTEGKLLLIKVKNLGGEIAWTFPKGHIEKGETAEAAALREVEEETGYRCSVGRALDTAQYWFSKDDILIRKTVKWFLMKPVEKVSGHNFEVLDTKWAGLDEAKELIVYKSDKKLLSLLSDYRGNTE